MRSGRPRPRWKSGRRTSAGIAGRSASCKMRRARRSPAADARSLRKIRLGRGRRGFHDIHLGDPKGLLLRLTHHTRPADAQEQEVEAAVSEPFVTDDLPNTYSRLDGWQRVIRLFPPRLQQATPIADQRDPRKGHEPSSSCIVLRRYAAATRLAEKARRSAVGRSALPSVRRSRRGRRSCINRRRWCEIPSPGLPVVPARWGGGLSV